MTRSICGFLLISIVSAATAFSQESSDPWNSPATLVELARDWKEFDLPIAPPDAVFATGDSDQGVQFIGRPKQTNLLLILALKEANGGKLGQYWTLTGPEPLHDVNWRGRYERVDFEVVAEGRTDHPVTSVGVGGRVPYLNDPLAMAVQAQLRHQPKLAVSLLRLAAEIEMTGFHRPGAYDIPSNPPEPRRALATLAWSYWRTQLIEPNTDRATTLSRLEKIIKAPLGPDTPENRQLIEDLKQTLKVKTGPTDGIEALIDDLTNMNQRDGWDISGGFTQTADLTDVDPRYRALWFKGFDAVPALIDHLDDGRLTRRDFPYSNGPSERIARVDDVVTNLLVDLSAGSLQTTRSRGNGLGYGLQPTEVQAWWTRAKATGEKKYLLDHVLPSRAPTNQFRRPTMPESPNMPEDVKARMREMEERMKRVDDNMQRDSCLPRDHLLHIIAAKYPDDLPDLYKRANEHCPQAPQHLLCGLLAQSTVKPQIKFQLLLETAHSPNPEARYAATLALSQMHGPATCAVVADGISSIPLQWEKGDMCKMATRWTRLVTECDDANNWNQLESVARRCDSGQRIEILWAMNCCGGESDCANRRLRIGFLARFLDDQAVREGSFVDTFDAGCGAKRLAVRDAAAYTIASILAMSPKPRLDADEAEWAAFRSRVRPVAEKEIKIP